MKSHLAEKHEELVGRREGLLTKFSQTARAPQPESGLENLFERIQSTNEFLHSLDRIADESKEEPDGLVPRYTVSSLFLHDNFQKLTADRNEQFVFITGTEVNGVFVLDQAHDLDHERRTPGGVTADTRSSHKLLIKFEQFGHRLLASFHSHPGRGAESTRPSGIDENFQRRLESAGHKAVMAIFSRDGYVRFLRLDAQFKLEIFGEGVEQHADNVYRLTNIDPA
jgi:hypothetical protein